MDDSKYKWLVRLLVVSWVSIVILVFVVFSLVSYQISRVHSLSPGAHVRAMQGPILERCP